MFKLVVLAALAVGLLYLWLLFFVRLLHDPAWVAVGLAALATAGCIGVVQHFTSGDRSLG